MDWRREEPTTQRQCLKTQQKEKEQARRQHPQGTLGTVKKLVDGGAKVRGGRDDRLVWP